LPGPDLRLLTEAAEEAGRIALRYWKANPKVWEKSGQGPVTEADLAINDMLRERLSAARPEYGWLSEETPDNGQRLENEYVFIIDPIDGTRAFIAGEKHFSHSLAIARNGIAIAAAICVPAIGQIFAAEAEGPATLNGTAIQANLDARIDGANILMSKAGLTADHWQGEVPPLRRSFRSSIAYRLCLVAEGAFDGMIVLRDTWEWDIAAGLLIAERAGARVTDRHDNPIRFNTKAARSSGIIAAPSALHHDLLSRMKR
jgi:myo-inositol-1(or 4)-monophosphatase